MGCSGGKLAAGQPEALQDAPKSDVSAQQQIAAALETAKEKALFNSLMEENAQLILQLERQRQELIASTAAAPQLEKKDSERELRHSDANSEMLPEEPSDSEQEPPPEAAAGGHEAAMAPPGLHPEHQAGAAREVTEPLEDAALDEAGPAASAAAAAAAAAGPRADDRGAPLSPPAEAREEARSPARLPLPRLLGRRPRTAQADAAEKSPSPASEDDAVLKLPAMPLTQPLLLSSEAAVCHEDLPLTFRDYQAQTEEPSVQQPPNSNTFLNCMGFRGGDLGSLADCAGLLRNK